MKNKRLKLSVILLLGLSLTGLQAQTMYVMETGGEQTPYSLSNVSKITFEDENVTVNQNGVDPITYEVPNLRYLSFKNHTVGISESTNVLTETLNTYPNPVQDVMNIDLSNVKNVNGTISILGIDGKLLQTRQIAETTIVTLDISSLSTGMYICRYSNSTEIKTVKIIKQ